MIEYLRQTKAEMAHVNWPSRYQTIVSTLIVIAVSLAVALYLGLLDVLFGWLLKLIWS